jgi:hypothetical protein
MITGKLEPTSSGTHIQWNVKLNGALPRWIRRPLCRYLATQKWKFKENFGTMEDLIEDAKMSAEAS